MIEIQFFCQSTCSAIRSVTDVTYRFVLIGSASMSFCARLPIYRVLLLTDAPVNQIAAARWCFRHHRWAQGRDLRALRWACRSIGIISPRSKPYILIACIFQLNICSMVGNAASIIDSCLPPVFQKHSFIYG